MLAQRAVTAIALGLLVIVGVFYLPPLGFDFLALLVIILAAWEFSGLFLGWDYKKRIGFLIFLTLVMLLAYWLPKLPILIIGVAWWIVVPYFLWRYMSRDVNCFTGFIWQIFLGVVTFVPCWVGLVVIRASIGMEFLFFLLAIVWATDIGAYFAGVFWGRHLLVPKISPKKTIEGLVGGIFSALVVAIIGVLLLKFNYNILSIFSLLILVVVSCLWSVIGDLFESMLKRQAGVKDSGVLFPGHGGVYDRIDSLLAAVPIFTLGIWLI